VKTLTLANGDLVVGPNGHATTTGHAKIRQDLALALGEPLKNDRFHTEWGSVLPTYIGQPMDSETLMLVKAEVARIIDQQMAIQQREIVKDTSQGALARHSTADVIAQVLGIEAELYLDRIKVTVGLVTMAGVRVNITRTVNI
jgi:phage baseplate assembly protein W